MAKIIVTKEQYQQVREAEKVLGIKIALAPKEYEMRVPDCVDGQNGIYKVKRCYKSGLSYIADVELLVATDTYEQALMHMMLAQQAAADQGKGKIIMTD